MDREDQKVMSLRLSRVMEDIGISRYMISRRRRMWLMMEKLGTIMNMFENEKYSAYTFGSQSEGNTTPGMQSDTDALFFFHRYSAILNLSDWRHGTTYLLVIKNEQLPPQHCWLQWVRNDLPLPQTHVGRPSDVVDNEGRVLHTNTQSEYYQPIREMSRLGEVVHHGPSRSWDENQDSVMAIHCASLPHECQFLFNRHRPGHWPRPFILDRARQAGVFLVPQGYSESPTRPSRGHSTALNVLSHYSYYPHSKWQWRFSTSLMERLLMFDMNITQHKTYVFLKVFCKTFFKPVVGDRLSTFHIKTAMLFTIETYPPVIWREECLLQCVIYCLTTLLRWLKIKYCPHYTISGVNLFTGKLFQHEQNLIRNMILKMISENISCAFSIQMDDIGRRLSSQGNCDNLHPVDSGHTSYKLISAYLLDTYVRHIHVINIMLQEGSDKDNYVLLLIQQIKTLERKHGQGTSIEQEACLFMRQHRYGILASILASRHIYLRQPITPDILNIYEMSFDSGMLSSRLKFASMVYCSGQYEAAANCLSYCESLLGPAVWQYCVCKGRKHQPHSREFLEKASYKSNKDMFKRYVAICVIFSRHEICCVPDFILYEMFRTVGDEDRKQRCPAFLYKWMDRIAIDCVPFLYYLQYLTYRQLNMPQRKQVALYNLKHYTIQEIEAPGHIDTAFHMLGHCCELENMRDRAWIYYATSLKTYPKNNAAVWHVAILLNKYFRTTHYVP